MVTVGSLFTGIGGIDVAFQEAGFEIVWQVEIDDYAQKVLDKRFPDTVKFRDIYDLILTGGEIGSLPIVDVITAGFP